MSRIRLTNAVVFDGVDLEKRPQTVILADDRIAFVGAEPPPEEPDETVIDVAGDTLLPGLIDAHYHCNTPSLNVMEADKLPVTHLAQYARHYLENTLEMGFTTVRDVGGADCGLAQAVDSGLIRGPRLVYGGPALSQTGGHGDMRAGIPVCGCAGYAGSLSKVVDGPDQIRVAIREEMRLGASHIKLFVSGGVLSPTDPVWMEQFTDAEILAAIEEAQRWRGYVAAHALTARSVRRCALLGVRSIEHALQMDAETADVVAASDSYVVATLLISATLATGAITLPPGALDKIKRVADQAMAAIAHGDKAGVKIGLGTDLLGQLHGRELEEFAVRASVSGNLRTLRAATSINAEIMQRDDIGNIRAGGLADVIVVRGNPLEDISAVTRPETNLRHVIRGGVIVK